MHNKTNIKLKNIQHQYTMKIEFIFRFFFCFYLTLHVYQCQYHYFLSVIDFRGSRLAGSHNKKYHFLLDYILLSLFWLESLLFLLCSPQSRFLPSGPCSLEGDLGDLLVINIYFVVLMELLRNLRRLCDFCAF